MIFLNILRWIGIILLCLVGLILVLSLIPIHLKVRYDKDFSAQLKILFFKKTLLPSGDEDEEEEPEEDEEEKPEKEKDESKTKPTVTEILSFVQESLSTIKKSVKFLCKGIRFRHMEILWRINAGDDAAATAQLYGKIQAATGVIMALMLKIFNVKKYRVHLEPDFLEEGMLFRAKADISFRLITLLLLLPKLVQLYFKYSRWNKELQTKNESVREKTPKSEPKVTENL